MQLKDQENSPERTKNETPLQSTRPWVQKGNKTTEGIKKGYQ